MTTVDNYRWISVNVYVVKDFLRVPMLLGLLKVIGGSGGDNLRSMIIGELQKILLLIC